MLKRYGKRLGAVACVTVIFALALSPALYAAGLWWGFPQIGGASYCVGYSTYPTTVTTPGTLPTPNSCNVTAPAGPTTFAGTEVFPVDIFGPQAGVTNTGPAEAYVSLVQVGQGPYVNISPGTSTTLTIPNNTPWYILSGAQGSAFTVTMPTAPVEGQIQRLLCNAATVGTLTVAAAANQTLENNPNTACVAGVGYAWRYIASSTTWYRFQ